jgi:plasmid stabilization system protein ParE
MTIEVRPAAQDDARHEMLYYDGLQVGLGRDFVSDLLDAYKVIQRQPQSFGRVQFSPSGREIRQYILRRFPYSVVYEILPGRIAVLAIIHHSRGPGYWLRRLTP